MGETEPKKEPQLDYKVAFWDSKFQRTLAQWLVTRLTRCITLITGISKDLQIHSEQGFAGFFDAT